MKINEHKIELENDIFDVEININTDEEAHLTDKEIKELLNIHDIL